MPTSSDDVDDTSTRAPPVDDGRGTAMSSPVPQSSATRPNRATPSPPAHQISSESNDESTSTQLQLDGDTRSVVEQQGAESNPTESSVIEIDMGEPLEQWSSDTEREWGSVTLAPVPSNGKSGCFKYFQTVKVKKDADEEFATSSDALKKVKTGNYMVCSLCMGDPSDPRLDRGLEV
mmetsp:Transcript_15036/g.21364  ORF Transcript_15036/g.21364 Transcript_15036/m.21364 type:complete len:177 (+) Transcript_15036:163-693(+)|eukprot:CAMPEP_0201688398 /NCGR_PEP_ID=MMETSP0578-20130828/2148_1 /ASSEMBLY_ACC=CAM_ASM_000663 /TAXON_ID=267565 /ORGANISM="Skeletonema grethea, Strain CCMP 1804" /LENGTH=176 /DNA_ID=CAMNT_0048172697 /DNA_START=108 /DNA_END=638 /DNA_ORIENTATION=-